MPLLLARRITEALQLAALPLLQAQGLQNVVTDEQLQQLAQPLSKNGYGQYLLRLLKENLPI